MRSARSQVLLVDACRLCRDSSLSHVGGLSIIYADSWSEADEWLESLEPDAVVLVLGAERDDECETVARYARTRSALVVVGDTHDEARVIRHLKAGASGYIALAEASERLAGAIQEAVRGGVPMSASVARLVLLRARRSSAVLPAVPAPIPAEVLSQRQQEVLTLLARGHSYEDMARALEVSVNTIRSHLRTIYERLGASTKVEAVVIAHELGLLR